MVGNELRAPACLLYDTNAMFSGSEEIKSLFIDRLKQ
jgi:hypothetical protein